MKQQRPGFRSFARKGKARPPDHLTREQSNKKNTQIYALIPGYDIAEVVEMVYKYKGKRRKLDHIFVQWPFSLIKRRFKMTPMIRLKKRKNIRWYQNVLKRFFEIFTNPGR